MRIRGLDWITSGIVARIGCALIVLALASLLSGACGRPPASEGLQSSPQHRSEYVTIIDRLDLELGRYAIKFAMDRGIVSPQSGVETLLVRRITRDEFEGYGLGNPGFTEYFPRTEPPMGIVVLHGDFDLSIQAMPLLENPSLTARYLVLVFELEEGAMLIMGGSPDRDSVRRLLDDARLPDE